MKNSIQSEIQSWFNHIYEKKSLNYLRPPEAYSVFLDLMKPVKGCAMLDVACGPGLLLKEASKRELTAYGVDISDKALAMSHDIAPEANVFIGNAESLPFRAESFDYITCIGSLERIIDLRAALKEQLRVAAPNALFCFMTRNSHTFTWQVFMRLLRLRNRRARQNAASLGKWKSVFHDQGFKILRIIPDQWPLIKRNRLWEKIGFTGKKNGLLKGVLPLRFSNEFIFLLKRASKDEAENRKGAGELYDYLSKYMYLMNLISPAVGTSPPVHKRLRLQGTGRLKAIDSGVIVNTDRWISRQLDIPDKEINVLDTGCGFGSTLFEISKTIKGRFEGLSTSPFQIEKASNFAKGLGAVDKFKFCCQSYDEPLEKKYDLIISVESLIHSKDLQSTIKNIASALRPGGVFMVLEDMATHNADMETGEAEAFKLAWSLYSIYTVDDFTSAISSAELEIVEKRDLTYMTPHRSLATLNLLLRVFSTLTPSPRFRPLRHLHRAFYGGFILESFYAKKMFHYIFLKARKNIAS